MSNLCWGIFSQNLHVLVTLTDVLLLLGTTLNCRFPENMNNLGLAEQVSLTRGTFTSAPLNRSLLTPNAV